MQDYYVPIGKRRSYKATKALFFAVGAILVPMSLALVEAEWTNPNSGVLWPLPRKGELGFCPEDLPPSYTRKSLGASLITIFAFPYQVQYQWLVFTSTQCMPLSCVEAGKCSSLCPSFLLAFIDWPAFGHSLYTTVASFRLNLNDSIIDLQNGYARDSHCS